MTCERCGETHDPSSVLGGAYVYLLGLYLGDGWLSRQSNGNHTLLLSLDRAYPGIIESASHAMATVARKEPWVRTMPENCVNLGLTWRAWPCLFPQHGPGRKHQRSIRLAPWQAAMFETNPQPLLRGLIETDGWRGDNRVVSKGKRYSYPRYQFSNRSDDIRAIFTRGCDLLGVEWRPWTRWHISVARRDSVAILDSFIGPKR